MSLSIKRLKRGKILLFLIGISPYAVYSAACFNYDAWVLAMTSLGLAYFLGAIQRPEEILSKRETVIMLGALALGILPKIPYIPLLLIPFLMPGGKFADKKQRKHYCTMLCILILALVVYALIYGFAGGDPVDERSNGLGNVSGTAQLIYVMKNPFSYLKMLLKFIFGGFIYSVSYLSSFAYLGSTSAYAVLIAAIAAAALTDNSDSERESMYIGLAGIAALLLALMLAATSMYIVFTPVGAGTINGCQPRYTVHLLFPFFMFLLNGWLKWNPPRRIYNPVFYLVGTGILIYNIYELVILPWIC